MSGDAAFRVVRPGLLTSVQDLGRHGLQHLGIVPGGAMDPLSHRIANALVGNADHDATLECTVLGPTLAFEASMLVALYGAEFDARLDGKQFPRNRPVLVEAGTTLAIGPATRGARACLAIAGGVQVAEVLGSRSTYLPAAFGGYAGRALKAGDALAGSDRLAELSASRFERLAHGAGVRVAHGEPWRTVRWLAPAIHVPAGNEITVRAMEGRHHAQFDATSREALFAASWRLSPDSNRMGYRLAGPRLARTRPSDVLSEPTCLGTVQVPNDGAPIALMADHQTTGGYPKIAEIAGADIPALAQLAPGGHVRFERCSVEDADAARVAADAALEQLLQAIASNFGGAPP